MRYYRKMLFTFIAIAVAYTVLLDGIFLFGYRRASLLDYERTVDAVSRQASAYTDYQLKSFQELGMLLRSNEALLKYLQEKPGEPDRYTRYQLYKYVNSIYGVASTQKRGIALTKLVDDYAILQNSTGSLAYLLEQFCLTQAQLAEAAAQFSGQIGQPLRLLTSRDAQGTLLYTIITRQWVGRQYPFYLLVSYTADQLFALDSNAAGTLAVFYQGALWTHAGRYDDATVQAALAGGTSLARRDLDSDIAGIRYVYLTGRPKAVALTSWGILGAGFAALAASIALMALITRRMYSPIADMLSVTGISAPSGDEFAELQETFETFKTNVETMSRSLSQQYDLIEHKFFHDLLTGLIPSGQAAEKMRQFGIPSGLDAYTVALIRYEETVEPGTDSGHGVVYEVRNALQRALRDNRRLFRAVDLNLTAQALIFRQVDAEGLQPVLRETLLTVEPAFGLEVTAYVGATVEGLSKVHDSYRVALRLSEQSAYSAIRAKVIVPGMMPPVPPGGEHNVYYPLNMEQTLIHAVIHGRDSVMRSTVRELITANAGEYRGNVSTLSLMLTATVNRILDGVKRSAADIFEADTIIYLEFRGCADYEALEAKAIELFSVLSEYLAAEAKKSAATIEKKMTDYIAQNYGRDISLHDLAGHVNLSKNYVSAQFKNATGQTFKDYLGELRHGKAREILEREPGVRIHEVAARVGCSPDTLLRLFMRYSGVSPSDYQQQCQRGGGT